MFDVIISNGTIIDGSDSSGFISDIGIVSDRIKVIGDLSDSTSKKKIFSILIKVYSYTCVFVKKLSTYHFLR